MDESYVFTQQITYCLLYRYIGAYKQYNSVYISPKQNYLFYTLSPRWLSEAAVTFINIGFV